MNSLMQQMSDNPTLMSQMMSAPYMQSMFSSLQSNPDQAGTHYNCQHYNPDPLKKVPDPDPAGQKSTDPTGSGYSSLF